MENIITLKSSDWRAVNNFSSCAGKDTLKKSFQAFLRKRLRHNKKTGKTYVGNEVVSSFSNKSDIPNDYDREDYIQYMFIPEIDNGASRLSRGYSVIG